MMHISISVVSMPRIRELHKCWYPSTLNNHTIEHIVPQSYLYDKRHKHDMHNMMLLPNKVNLHRSNYKYVESYVLHPHKTILDEQGNIVLYNAPFSESRSRYIKSNLMREFTPIKIHRGKIARACMYMAVTYPTYSNTIFARVLDPYVLLSWHHEHPVSEFERKKNNCILDIQGNENPYISKPYLVTRHMEEIIQFPLTMYNHYDYSSSQDEIL